MTDGTVLDVIESGDGVFLRKPRQRQTLTVEEATRRLRELYRHEGPPIPIERLSWSPDVADPGLDRHLKD
jgi:hypothetical protein